MRLAHALGCLALSGPAVLAGQQTDTVQLAPVVVTATRLPAPATALPEAVTVLRGADLQAAGVRTVFEALRDVPGATVVETGSFGGQTSLFLRGGQSDYVKVLVDGVPVNQPGGAFDFANLTTDNVDRIEVLRGPASVLYGSDAVTGVVQIFTRQGVGPGRADVSAQGATYNTGAWHASAEGASAVASYSVAVSRFTSDGIYAFNNQYHNTAASSLLRVTPDARTDAALSLRYDDNTYHFPTNGYGVPVDSSQYSSGRGPTIGLDVGHRFTPRLETRLLLGANATDAGYSDLPDSANFSTQYQSRDKQLRVNGDLRANLRLVSGPTLTAGAAYETERDESSNSCESGTPPTDCSTPPTTDTRHNSAVYLQVAGDPVGRAGFTGGVRVEDNERFGTFVTVRLGASYRVAPGTRLRVTAGNAFREPTFAENYSTGYSVGNPALEPEQSRSGELGLDQSLAGGRLSLSATVFDQLFRQMIDYNPSAAPGAPNYENIAGATARGAELGVRALPTATLVLAASYTYLSTDVTSGGFDTTSGAALAVGRPLLRRPTHSGRLDLVYHPVARGTLSLAATYVGQRDDQDFSSYPAPRVTLPPHTSVDLAGSLTLVGARGGGGAPQLVATGRIENLLDARYQEVKDFPARGRTIFVGARLGFGY